MKRCIAMLMLALYLFAVGGAAYGAMTCHCVADKARTEHRCCPHCDRNFSAEPASVHFNAPCCGDHHSTEIELYTASPQDGERMAKRLAAQTLPPAILAEPVVSLNHTLRYCGFVPDAGISSVPDSHISSCGLRAPPALV